MSGLLIPDRCPTCDATDVRVVEDVSDEVTVFGCDACGMTWADRTDRPYRDPADPDPADPDRSTGGAR